MELRKRWALTRATCTALHFGSLCAAAQVVRRNCVVASRKAVLGCRMDNKSTSASTRHTPHAHPAGFRRPRGTALALMLVGSLASCSTTDDAPEPEQCADFDADGVCDVEDPDDDNDGVSSIGDSDDTNPRVCADTDADGCDDCSTGTFSPAADGTDTDADGLCDVTDTDLDNDGVSSIGDSDDTNPRVCADTDADGCDDCSTGTFNPAADGTDTDADGLCDVADTDLDNDGVSSIGDSDDTNPRVCSDIDADGCNDCSSGTFNTAADGADYDGDGQCDVTDPDDDGDGVLDSDDSAPTNPRMCSDTDSDGCDDCSSGSYDVADDGFDFDCDGICNVTDPLTDTSAPTLGSNAGIKARDTLRMTLKWGAAADDVTPAACLQYKVVYSLANNLLTAVQANQNGAVSLDWTPDTQSHVVTGLTADTLYHFAVLVRDVAGHIVLFGPGSFTASTTSPGYYEFSHAGASGRQGPSKAEIDAAYEGTSLEGAVTATPTGIQEWTVPKTATYRIEAYGAQGATNGTSYGQGAVLKGDFSLNAGDTLRILVGQQGVGTPGNYAFVGGGGGTFVAAGDSLVTSYPLIVGGGGGGTNSVTDWYTQGASCGATTTSGNAGYGDVQGGNDAPKAARLRMVLTTSILLPDFSAARGNDLLGLPGRRAGYRGRGGR